MRRSNFWFLFICRGRFLIVWAARLERRVDTIQCSAERDIQALKSNHQWAYFFAMLKRIRSLMAGLVWNFGAQTSSGETFVSAAEDVGRKWNVCQTEQLVTFLYWLRWSRAQPLGGRGGPDPGPQLLLGPLQHFGQIFSWRRPCAVFIMYFHIFCDDITTQWIHAI
jgi:hypothetical protein